MTDATSQRDDRAIYISLLGTPRWRIDGREHPLASKDALLFAILALHGPQQTNALVRQLWPEYTLPPGRANLRQRISRLRQATSHLLFSFDDRVALLDNVDIDAWQIDSLPFEYLIQCGDLLEGVSFRETELQHQLVAERDRTRLAIAKALGTQARIVDEGSGSRAGLAISVDRLSTEYSNREQLLKLLRSSYARGDERSVESAIRLQEDERARADKTVFISYRRQDGSWALNVYQWLTQRGYDVFIDYSGIGSGSFEATIIANILARAHFLVVLSPRSLDRCKHPGDWLRREVEQAIEAERNIVPILVNDFSFTGPGVQATLTGDLFHLQEYNGLELTTPAFQDQMLHLARRFLSVPLDAVIHPPSLQAVKAAKKQQAAANAAIALEQLEHMRAKAARLSAELAKSQEDLAAFQCPHCGALLVQRTYGSESVEYRGREIDVEHEWESFECGYAVTDGREQSPCRNIDPHHTDTSPQTAS